MSGSPYITIFVATKDRLETLTDTIEAYERLTYPHEICIIDNGSTDVECRDHLKTLHDHVKQIYWLPSCDTMTEVSENYNHAIRHQFGKKSGDWYAISDVDVCFDKTPNDALEVYIELAQELGTAVGPHLQVNDIPAHYPLRSRVLACESRLLYRDVMEWSANGFPYTYTQTDTTFHLFSKRRRFERLHMNPVRVGPPYTARHTDWYLDIENPTRENAAYMRSEMEVGSWGKSWLRDFWKQYQVDPEVGYQHLVDAPCAAGDLCCRCFMLSWCLQFGQGCRVDLEASLWALRKAIPVDHPHYAPYESRWREMIYSSNYSSLGWDA